MPPKLFLFPIICFLFTAGLNPTALAQRQAKHLQDVVYLKNGGIMRGKLVEITDSFSVVLETEDKNRYVFGRDQVERLARERPLLPLKEKGFINYTEAGLLVGRSSEVWDNSSGFYYLSPTIQTFNGYQFAPALQLGLTAGVDLYNNVALVPLALGLRGDLSRSKITPFYSLDLGYGFPWLNERSGSQRVRGGRMWQPGLGIKVLGKSGSSFVISVGYKSLKAETFVDQNWRTVQEQLHFQRFALRTGISF